MGEVLVLGSGNKLESWIEWYKAYVQNLIPKLAPVSIAHIELANVL